MNEKAKALWLDALRSGEYRQFQGALKGVDEDGEVGYCCLGVLTDIAIKTGAVSGEWAYHERSDRHGYRDLGGNRLKSGVLPWDVAEWAGLCEDGEPVEDFGLRDDSYLDLPARNDGGTPFSEIADIIEENL